MAHDAPQATGPSKLVIRNIGLLLSGALEKPILDADTIVAENGKITAIGRFKDVDTEGATTIVDAMGTTVAPGLIDSHVHPVAGDWTPRQNQINWIDSYLHGGVTTMISAGEVHMPGRPRDVVGLKAMAIFAQRAFWTLRPGGVKVHAGAPVIECEMVEDDFREMAAAIIIQLPGHLRCTVPIPPIIIQPMVIKPCTVIFLAIIIRQWAPTVFRPIQPVSRIQQ